MNSQVFCEGMADVLQAKVGISNDLIVKNLVFHQREYRMLADAKQKYQMERVQLFGYIGVDESQCANCDEISEQDWKIFCKSSVIPSQLFWYFNHTRLCLLEAVCRYDMVNGRISQDEKDKGKWIYYVCHDEAPTKFYESEEEAMDAGFERNKYPHVVYVHQVGMVIVPLKFDDSTIGQI